MYPIIQRHITANFEKTDKKMKYIVLHDTGNASPSASADAHRRYFCDKTAKASYHYVCDENEIIECVGEGYAAYHAGVGKSGIRPDGKKSDITNFNSVGVAYCIQQGADMKKAVQNAADCCVYACLKYGLTPADIVRHYDVTEKVCPKTMHENRTGISGGAYPWNDFDAFKELVWEKYSAYKESEAICSALTQKGAITETEYWKAVLMGEQTADERWLRLLFKRLLGI